MCNEAREEHHKKKKSKNTSGGHCLAEAIAETGLTSWKLYVHMSYLSSDREVAYQRVGTAKGREG